MKSVSGKEFGRLLQSEGWSLARVNGSHHIYIKDGVAARISVPVYSNQTLKSGLQRNLMKIAGINEEEL